MVDYVNINIAGRSKENILAWIVEVTLWGRGYNAPVFVTAGTGVVIPEDLKAFENAVRNDLPGYLYRNFNIRMEAPKGMPAKVVPKAGRKKK